MQPTPTVALPEEVEGDTRPRAHARAPGRSSIPRRACGVRRCGRVGWFRQYAVSDVASTFFEGPLCPRHRSAFTADVLLLVEELDE
jgi:hypothetical protein